MEKGLTTKTEEVLWNCRAQVFVTFSLSSPPCSSHFVTTFTAHFASSTQVYETPFFVAVDHAKKKVVISIRGTLSPKVNFKFLILPYHVLTIIFFLFFWRANVSLVTVLCCQDPHLLQTQQKPDGSNYPNPFLDKDLSIRENFWSIKILIQLIFKALLLTAKTAGYNY